MVYIDFEGVKKKILSMILVLACLFSLSSCSLISAYDSEELIGILEKKGYEIKDIKSGI